MQHISLIIIADIYKTFKFDRRTLSSISLKKGNILQKSM